VAILVDLAGPKIRLGTLFADPLTIEIGQTIRFIRGATPTMANELTCTYSSLVDEVLRGDMIVLADGFVRLEVIDKTPDSVVCKVIDGGTIRSRQGVNLPGAKLSVPALGPVDRDHANWAASREVDYVGLSFVRNEGEVRELKAVLASRGSNAGVIAKIEKPEALENLESIVRAADGIMVARGDLGVEIAIEKTPLAQKRIIRICSEFRKPVVVATQMLESMHHSKQPTRAEASDVANAILDGADACMLSGETAIGQYPGESVAMMRRIMLETEELLKGRSSRLSAVDHCPQDDDSEAMVLGAAQIARRLNAKLVAIASSINQTPILKSKQRDYIPTICLTDNKNVLRRMCLYWGIVPVYVSERMDAEQLRSFTIAWAKSKGWAAVGEPIVIMADTEWLSDARGAIMVCRIA
jgi:pyruvate kinase